MEGGPGSRTQFCFYWTPLHWASLIRPALRDLWPRRVKQSQKDTHSFGQRALGERAPGQTWHPQIYGPWGVTSISAEKQVNTSQGFSPLSLKGCANQGRCQSTVKANVTQISKKGKDNLGKYGTVSLTCVPGKVVECLILRASLSMWWQEADQG